ncbi:hypothetical protein AKUA1404_09180 [Apilactobacillus kunkeei]|nr:hypothetical protein AKUA1404_09180 [Apilactobacillus kunkeei]
MLAVLYFISDTVGITFLIGALVNMYVKDLLFRNEMYMKEYIVQLRIEDRRIKFDELIDITFINFISYILFVISAVKFLLYSFGNYSMATFLFVLFAVLGSIVPWICYRKYIKRMKRTFYKYFDINTFEEK